MAPNAASRHLADHLMTTLTKSMLGLAIIGLICFAFGVRVDDSRVRMIGIGFVFAAWILRFFRPRAPR